ncbi:MAG: N-acetylmuramoyl-L-alanine amidase [Chthoniobacterales bacterium]|nr:N-acetylmuramoyl-L-alanine amidase [Chthoniobacterales bacterium]
MFTRRLTLAFIVLLLSLSPAARAIAEEMPNEVATNLSTLGRKPDWKELEKYQSTITHDEFVHLLNDVYCTHGISDELIKVGPDEARILTHKGTEDYFVLHFAKSDADRLPLDRPWRPLASLPEAAGAGPLGGVHIALDPGHLGGSWAKMEERWFKIKEMPPIQEGDMTLQVAQLLAPRLQSLGAKVSFVRAQAEPLTPYRPSDFRQIALQLLQRAGISDAREDFDGPADPRKEQTVRWQEELLFYRNSEIRRRASLVNYNLQPDLLLCLHFNAEPWGDPASPTLVEKDHLHLLVNGSYLQAELDLDDERCEMLHKLLSRAYPEELDLAESIALTMAKTTGLPPYQYKTGNVTPVGASGYIFARNLMATRLYRCPTIYLEPYVMNSREVFARVQAGDYEGMRPMAGKKRPSIFHEYVEGVVGGMLTYFKRARP